MICLGIDFGEKKIGLALAFDDLIEPYKTIKVKNWKEILDICRKEKVERIVIGFSKGRLTKKIKSFGEKLRKILKILVIYQDEALSSYQAVKTMVEIGKPKLKRRVDDSIAAALILKDYLSKNGYE